MVGRDLALPPGYRGLVMGLMNPGYQEGAQVELEALGEFARVTEWKKDAWTSERGYGENIRDYLECARILHE
jgi:hypothetical protein